MGEKNIALNGFLSCKKRFADLFNAFLFNGKQKINADDLSEASEHYREAKDGVSFKGMERIRDVKMQWRKGGALRILAIESQSLVDYAMPFRCMQYDCLEYSSQLRQLKRYNVENQKLKTSEERLCGLLQEDRLAPVYTLCLYHGEDTWNGPRSLCDMMNFSEDEEMKEYFNDYPLKILCINEYEDFELLHTDLREVFTALKYRRDKRGLYRIMQEHEWFRHLNEEAVRVMAVLLDMPSFWKERKKYLNYQEVIDTEEYDMCQAIREMVEDGRTEGKIEGKIEGVILASRIFKLLQLNSSLKNEEIAQECDCSLKEVQDVRAAFGI